MITRDEIIPLLIAFCPTFEPTEGQELVYVVLGDFARHLLELHRANTTECFPAVAQMIERLHLEGDSYVREAATIGLLEGIQNNWSHDGTDPELFFQYLLPESAKWWKSLNDFWGGKSKFVGEGF